MTAAFYLLFFFVLTTSVIAGREVTVRLNANQETGETRKVPLEEYAAAVLAGESVGFRSGQALEAMAVAARTYAVRFEGRHRSEGYDFCDTTHCQDARFSAVTDRLRKAAEATESELLWFGGAPAATFYGKDCGGSGESASVVWPDLKAPYLGRRDDTYCGRAGWSAAIGKAELRSALAASGVRAPVRFDGLRIVERTASGRALRLQAGGLFISAPSLRFAVGRALGWNRILSDLYEIADSGDRFVFTGRGGGHGVGLCQVGAERMGLDGSTYRQILEYYYPGTRLGVTAQGFAWRSLGGERVEVITTKPREDQFLVALADRLVRTVEQRLGLMFGTAVRLKVFPTIAAFRDSTGEPGWVAASTRGGVIRLQPVSMQRSIETTLQHEMVHVLVERHARAGLPVWFREGIVLHVTASQKSKGKGQKPKVIPPDDAAFRGARDVVERAYDAAAACVTDLVARFGEPAALSWIERGLPPNLFASAPTATPGPARR